MSGDSGAPGASSLPVVAGPCNALTDVAGVEVGHATHDDLPRLTGVTAILTRSGAVAAVDVRGAAPATRETDTLSPGNLVDEVHAVVLCGGSAYGLAAVDGVMRFLEENGAGRPVGAKRSEIVPIVPAAALFDLGRGGDFSARPDPTSGYQAAASARPGPLEQGNVGAGTGALFGQRRLKGGIGSASAVAPWGTVAALVALNAVGSALDPASGLLLGAAFALGDELGPLGAPSDAELSAFALTPGESPGAREHTVIGVVATDVELSGTEARRMACVAHDGLARAVRPSHTLFDGDVLFALSTARRSLSAPGQPGGEIPTAGHGAERGIALVALCELAADCVTRAVVHAVLAASSVAGFVAYGDAFPSAVARRGLADERG